MSTTSTTQQAQRNPFEAASALDTITADLVARQSRSDDGSMSVPDQVDAMVEWCARQNPPVMVGKVHTEYDVSGRKPLDKRTGLKVAVERVERGEAQMILTAYFDRFVRSVATRAEVLTRVEDKGGTVMTMDFGKTSNATPVSKFTGTVLAAAAELIAEQAGEKTAVTKQRNIDKGIPPFPRVTPAYERIPDGDDKGRLRPHPVNGPIVRDACLMRANGASYTTIQRFLAAHGIKMAYSAVKVMLSSRLLVGELHFGGFRPNLHAIDEPIIDQVTFRRMHKAKATRGRYAKSERLLARQNVLVCETCGARLTVHTTTGAGGTKYHYYRCGDRLCTAPAMIAAEVAEDVVRDKAIELSADVTGRASAQAQLEAARAASKDAEDRLANAIHTLAGLGAEAATRDVLDELQAARDVAVAEHERLLTLTTPDQTLRTVDDWNLLTLDERRDVIRAVIARAVVVPGRGPDRITVEGHTFG